MRRLTLRTTATGQMASDVNLIFCMDLSVPDSLMGLAPTRALARETGCGLTLLPLTRDVGALSTETAKPMDDGLLDFKARRDKVRQAYNLLDRRRELDLHSISSARQSPVSVTRAALALLWLGEQENGDADEFLTSLLQAYWIEEEDAFAPAAIDRTLAAYADLQGFDGFVSGPGPGRLDAVQTDLAEARVIRAPTYLLDGERYIGREHLPLIRWHLLGREGRPPV